MKKLLKLFTFISLFLLSNSIFSQDNPFIDVGHLGGEIKCSAIKGEYAFLGQANYFLVVDKSQENFEKKAELKFKEALEGMFVLDDFIYLVSDSLFIIDITNPLDPILVSKMKLDEPSNKIFVEGGYAYIARFGSISVVDISDVNSPQAISNYVTGQQTDDLFIKGKYLYTIDDLAEKLFIYNVEDKSNLNLVNLFNSPNPTSIDIVGDYLYLTTKKYPDIGLNIFDITNPELPVKKGFIETKTVDGNHTYFRNPAKVKVKENTAYIITSFGYFFIINISDKTNPVKLSNQSVFNVYSSVFSMDIDENKVYLALFSLGFKEIDVSDSSNPSVSNKLNEVGRINWMQADSNYFVASSRNGLWIYDNKPENPVLIKQYQEWINISHFFLENNKVIAITQDSLVIIDITDPSSASALSSYKPMDHANELFASGNYVFLTINGEKKTFEILDISDPQNPNQLSSIEIPGVANDIFVDNNKDKAFLTYRLDDINYGYIIIDISNLSSPSILSDVKTNGIPSPIFAQGDSLYVGSNTGEIDNPVWNLEIFEISNANSPTSVASTLGEGNIWDIEVFGETIFAGVAGQSLYEMVALPDGTISMVDVSHSLSTIGIDIYNLDGFYEIYTLEGYKYIKYGEEKTEGGGGVRKKKKKKKKNGGGICCVTFGIAPAKAASDGCKTTPDECKSGGCGKELNIEAIPTSDWLFYKWSGAINSPNRKEKISYKDKPCQPGVQCENVAVANFTPWFLIKGGQNTVECPIEYWGESYTFDFALQASLPDDWLVSSIKIKLSGDDKVLSYLKKAKLDWGGIYEVDGKGAGFYKFTTDNLIVAKGTTKPMHLELIFDEMIDMKCPFDPTSIEIEIKTAYVIANPSVFIPGVIIGMASGERKIGCILNEDQEKQYSLIQQAVEDANEGEYISICPGIYEENIEVDKDRLTIESEKGAKETIIKSNSSENPVLSLKSEGIEILGLKITNENNDGIKVEKDNCTIKNCIIEDNFTNGVSVEGKYANIEDNTILKNATGILVKGDSCVIQSNKIIKNNEYGILLSGGSRYAIIYGNNVGTEFGFIANPNKIGIKIDNLGSNFIGKEGVTNRNLISGNSEVGILIIGDKANNVSYNYIGIDESGEKALPNKIGISIESSFEHLYGNVLTNNIISGNTENGILLEDSDDNLIYKNYIGLNNLGNNAIPNRNGIVLLNNSDNNKIGSPLNPNIISGNTKNGILLDNSNNNGIIENYIGLSKFGKEAIPNKIGLSIKNSTETQVAKNIISGNTENGILLDNSHDNEINGCFIGLNKDGDAAIPNKNGIVSRNNSILNSIGIKFKNIISGNTENGILIDNSKENILYNNFIGLNRKGDTAIPNKNGVLLQNNSDNNTIGTFESLNIICGNTENGILINNSNKVTIEENYIGINLNGNGAIPNKNGINIIRGIKNSIKSNIISGNSEDGVRIESFSSNNSIFDNNIGLNVAKDAAIPNKNGIYLDYTFDNSIFKNIVSGNKEDGIIFHKAMDNLLEENYIGTYPDGILGVPNKNGIHFKDSDSNSILKNIVSGNTEQGILIDDGVHNVIKNNMIGINETGEYVLSNENGILIKDYSYNNKIMDGNIISGNYENGILIENAFSGNYISDNFIGTDKNGKTYVPNKNGINIVLSREQVVSKNLISGNFENGIIINGGKSTDNEIRENIIGLSIDKAKKIPNSNGILINDTEKNLIDNNIISGNVENGIKMVKSGKIIIEKNKIGIGKSLSHVFPNKNGIFIFQSNENKIASKNTISGNIENGIFLYDSHDNVVNNNYIGTHNPAFGQKTGVKILHGLKETVTNNTIVNNCVGIKILDSRKSNIANNYLYHNTCHSSAIHLENSGGKISGNNITKDAGDAINCSKGSNPFIVKNNIFDNSGFALNNEDANVHIIAQNNWWGENTDPNASINGNVDYTNWSSISNDLVIATESDTAYTAPSQSDSLNLYYRNWVYDMDSIDVAIVDSLGWIDSLSQSTFIFPDSLGGSNIVYFSVPDVPQGTIDKVIVKAISLIDTSWTNIDSFFIRAYFRALSRIDITPDTTVSLVLYDSLQFNAIGLDSFDNFFPAELVWSCTGGEIDSTGLYRATETGSFDILVSNTDSSVWAKAEVIVLPVGTINPTKPKNDLILYQNYPNPFGDKTTIKFTLNKSGNTSLTIYDFMGNKRKTLTNRLYPEGTYEVDIKEKSLTPGQYFYVLKQGNKRVVKKMVVY